MDFCNLCADDIYPEDDVYEADGYTHHLECAVAAHWGEAA